MNVPLEKFLRDQCADLGDKETVIKVCNTWCDYHIDKGGCDVVDPTMVKSLGIYMELKNTLANATKHLNQWVQDGEGLKQRWSAAATAMKNRQYSMAINACPEKNPEDSEDYMMAVTNITDWEQLKLDAHQRESLQLEDKKEQARVNMMNHLHSISQGVCDWIKDHYMADRKRAGDEPLENVDAEMMAELEAIMDKSSYRHQAMVISNIALTLTMTD